MINDDVLVKLAYQVVKRTEASDYIGRPLGMSWPELAFEFRQELENIKFKLLPGLGDNCLSLVDANELKDGDLFVCYCGKVSPSFVFEFIEHPQTKEQLARVHTIGKGISIDEELSIRPGVLMKLSQALSLDHNKFRGKKIKIDAKPKVDGGAGYYFFNKSPRDLRLSGFSVINDVEII